MLGSPNWSRSMDLSAMTHAEKLALARAMVAPIRCGGWNYRDGVPIHRDGTPVMTVDGKGVTREDFQVFAANRLKELAAG